MQTKYLYGLIGLLIGGLAVGTFTSNSVTPWNMMGNNTESSFNQGMMNNSQIDAHFIEQMIPHHQDAITMAKLALEKGQHQEIKTLAQNIITSQSSEIEQMKNLYKDWYGRELPTGNQVMNVHGMMSNRSGMHMGKMGDDSDLDHLKNATDFDQVFIEEMIPHHQMALMMASMLKNGTNRPEMKQLADSIITAQSSEIDQMRKWHQDWSK
jgi:uncharacterized protein (DUF305 family)